MVSCHFSNAVNIRMGMFGRRGLTVDIHYSCMYLTLFRSDKNTFAQNKIIPNPNERGRNKKMNGKERKQTDAKNVKKENEIPKFEVKKVL